MPIEIERKFLLLNDDWRAEASRSIAMRQGYLSEGGGRASMRVRVEGALGKLNIKAAVAGAARAEFEYDIPLSEAEEMLATLCGGLILKRRHYVDRDGLTWEIDLFEGANAGLVVAEVELSSVDQEFPRPIWLGLEVTAEQRYYNHALSKRPYAEWSEIEQRPAPERK
jgi:adenylate cyclase